MKVTSSSCGISFTTRGRRCAGGAGRGSAAGSLVSYALRITDVDPLQYNLLFERFLNPERVSMPDIDIDFCMRRRGELIEYVTQKYGRETWRRLLRLERWRRRRRCAVLGPPVDVPDDVALLRVGTLSKTLGALGGFVAGPQRYTDLLVNRARAYMSATASSPADAAAALTTLRVLRSPEGDEAARPPARRRTTRLRPGHPSPVVPYVCGSERARLKPRARATRHAASWLTAIRPPTVPPGTVARLRVAISADHTTDQVDGLAAPRWPSCSPIAHEHRTP